MSDKPVICVGAALIDDIYLCKEKPLSGTSNPATFQRSPGGVARNIAHHLSILGNNVELITHLGNDIDGQFITGHCKNTGISIVHSKINQTPTGHFVAMLSPDGDLFAGAVSTHFESEIDIPFLNSKISVLASASILLIDCNLSIESLNWLLDLSREKNIPCIIEPVSVPKAGKLLKANLEDVLLITPNYEEMEFINGKQTGNNIDASIRELKKRGVQYIWFRNGKNGSRMFSNNEVINLPAPPVTVVDSVGAGDAALAGWMHAYLLNKTNIECMRYGHALASLVLQSKGSVAEHVDSAILEKISETLR
jgi:pseudouridine kinase